MQLLYLQLDQKLPWLCFHRMAGEMRNLGLTESVADFWTKVLGEGGGIQKISFFQKFSWRVQGKLLGGMA